MALVRCALHRPVGIKRTYVRSVEPVGYPDTAAVCGSSHCTEPGLVWLDEKDAVAYEAGERLMKLPNEGIKIRVR